MAADVFHRFIALLAKRAQQRLPGNESQYRMAPEQRQPVSLMDENIAGYKTAAVLALIVPDPITFLPRIVLIERSIGQVAHSGQISFPGGKKEGDEDLLTTALRESNEELGIAKEQVQMIGSLTSLYIPPSNFFVHPFLGYMNHVPEFILSESEVQRVILPDLHAFVQQENILHGEFSTSSGKSIRAPYYKIDDVIIWGATAMMISEIADLIRNE